MNFLCTRILIGVGFIAEKCKFPAEFYLMSFDVILNITVIEFISLNYKSIQSS